MNQQRFVPVFGLLLWLASGAAFGAAPQPTGGDDSAALQSFIAAGGGDLGGNSYNYSQQLTGAIKLSNGTLNYTGSAEPLVVSSNSDLEHLTISGGTHLRIADNSTGVTIHGSTLIAVNATGVVQNIAITANTFAGSSTEFTAIFLNSVGNNVVITDNTFEPIHEAIHVLGGTASGFVCSYNEIIGAQRIGIELQFQAQGAIIQGNLIHKWRKNPGDNNQSSNPSDSHIGISAALGPSSGSGTVTPQTVYSNVTLIDSNVINYDGATDQPLTINWSQIQGIEFMGNNGTVSNNWIRNAGFNAYTWTNGFASKNNVWVGLTGPQPWNGEPGGPAIAPTVSGDQSFGLNAGNAPAPPQAGPRVATPANGQAVGGNINLAAVNNTNGTGTFTWADPTGGKVAPTVTVLPTYGVASQSVNLGALAAGATSLQLGNIPQNWVITVTVSYGPGQPSGTTIVQITGGPNPAAGWQPQTLPVTGQ